MMVLFESTKVNGLMVPDGVMAYDGVLARAMVLGISRPPVDGVRMPQCGFGEDCSF